MQTYIALLKGINVGGHKKIKMADLKVLLASNKFKNVRTYIQSGNIIFESEDDIQEISSRITTAILAKYGFEVSVLVLSGEKLSIVFKNNPFLKKDKHLPIEKLYVAFLEDKPIEENTEKLLLKDFKKDKWIIKDDIVYIYYDEKYSQSKLNHPMLERTLKLNATIRNWKTVSKLIEMMA